MTRFDEDVLELAMVQTQAWERLNDPAHCGGLSMVELEGLMVRAGFSRKEAHRAAMKRGWDRLSAGEAV